MSLVTWDDGKPRWKVRGQHVEDRLERRRTTKAAEAAEKAKVRKRDLPCRWPGCTYVRTGYRPEVAHLVSKGMGGDHGATPASGMMRLCFAHHQGVKSLHSGDRRVECETPAGANGPCSFWERGEDGAFAMVARELAVNGPYEKD